MWAFESVLEVHCDLQQNWFPVCAQITDLMNRLVTCHVKLLPLARLKAKELQMSAHKHNT